METIPTPQGDLLISSAKFLAGFTDEDYEKWLATKPPGYVISAEPLPGRGTLDEIGTRKNAIYAAMKSVGKMPAGKMEDDLTNLENPFFDGTGYLSDVAADRKTVLARARKTLDRWEAWLGSYLQQQEKLAKQTADMRAGKIPGPSAGKPIHYESEPVEIKATWKSAADLHNKTFTPVSYVIPKYLAEGCTLLAGRPKIGKSWLTEDAALAVAAGTEVLGEKVEQGDVLLLALEDNERRLQERFKKILGPWQNPAPRLYYETEWPRTDEGGLEKIRAWIDSVPNARLIIIDVLARIRPLQQGRAPQYDIDYQIVASLQKIASEKRIAIIVVTHVRKSGSESGDAIDKISGTLGLSGAADSFMVLDRDGQGVTLYTRGRDIEEISVAITFNPGRCRWTVLGQAGEVRKSDERRLILDALGGSSTGMTRADIATVTEMKSNNVGVLLNKMMKAGEIMRAVGGCYLTTPDNTVTAVTALTPSQ